MHDVSIAGGGPAANARAYIKRCSVQRSIHARRVKSRQSWPVTDLGRFSDKRDGCGCRDEVKFDERHQGGNFVQQ